MSIPRAFVLIACLGNPSLDAAIFQESWQTGYKGKDATGDHVLGYWTFDAGDGLKDGSGKGHDLVLKGATLHGEGRWGRSLECENSPAKSHSAMAGGKEGLTPKGAFTLEMWVKPRTGFEKTGGCHLVDKRYTPDNHTDYAWKLTEPDKAGLRRMSLTLGFGTESETFHSEPVKLEADAWQHLAAAYDAAGTVTFYRDGSLICQITKPGFGPVKPGGRDLYIGDRGGSTYSGFPGLVDEVRLSSGVLRFESVDMEIRSQRHVWQRMEKAEPMVVTCTNLQRQPVTGARLSVSLGEKSETLDLPALAPGESRDFKFTLDTSLKPAVYTLAAKLDVGTTHVEKRMRQEIVPRPVPAMPVILWGTGDIPRMKDVGFTHYMALGVSNMGGIWQKRRADEVPPAAEPQTIAGNLAVLDEALSAGLNIVSKVSPRGYLEGKPEMLRADRQGKPYERKDIVGLNPELPVFFEKVGRSLGATYGGHPAMAATLVDTETRDASLPSFTPLEVAAYKGFSGTEIPTAVQARNGVDWTKIEGFPADRVIPDDDPVLKYYRWFWTVGDGWNGLHSALSDGVKATARKGHWTFFDPAVRQPSISGAGGGVDVLSHWTYTYPEPQRIGLATDQLLAMSEASGKKQHVMKMTQLIWYRSQTSPTTKARPEDPVPWVDQDPDAAYITIAPMHLREAFWTKLSRPIEGIMYHGWQSLVPTANPNVYKYTNPNTVHVLKELIQDVVRPLGPALLAVPDERAEVAFLESFTSQMFARRGGYGNNNGWSAEVWMALQHAHVRTDVLYEETLLKDGLDGRSILVMPDCDVLTNSVVKRIRDWQSKGGKIIADENLCPALKADLVLPGYKRTRKAAEDHARLLAMAARLGPEVAALGHTPEVTADTPEVILRMRRAGDARYLFVINDRREAGNYVGQAGLVLENGLPTRTVVTLAKDPGTIYDLTRGCLVTPQRDAAGSLRWPVDLAPCDGRIFLILPQPLREPVVEIPETVRRGMTAELKVRLSSTQEQPLKAVIPLEVKIRDANGKEAEGSGFYATENGLLSLPLSIASNEDPGAWEIRVTELGSRMETTRYLTVKP